MDTILEGIFTSNLGLHRYCPSMRFAIDDALERDKELLSKSWQNFVATERMITFGNMERAIAHAYFTHERSNDEDVKKRVSKQMGDFVRYRFPDFDINEWHYQIETRRIVRSLIVGDEFHFTSEQRDTIGIINHHIVFVAGREMFDGTMIEGANSTIYEKELRKDHDNPVATIRRYVFENYYDEEDDEFDNGALDFIGMARRFAMLFPTRRYDISRLISNLLVLRETKIPWRTIRNELAHTSRDQSGGGGG